MLVNISNSFLLLIAFAGTSRSSKLSTGWLAVLSMSIRFWVGSFGSIIG